MVKRNPHQRKELVEVFHQYQNSLGKFKPENYNEIARIFGPSAAIDMNRLVCQHQQHVASAYMRRIKKDKVKQRDMYFQKLQNIPMKIRRMAVAPNYVDPYTNFKARLPKLGQDDKIRKASNPIVPANAASPYVPHNSLAPHMNLFKMHPPGAKVDNPAGFTNKGSKPQRSVEEDLPFPINSPRKYRGAANDLPPIRKRISVETGKIGIESNSSSEDNSPYNTPRNAFWSFNIPTELNKGTRRSHVSSIPKGKEALAAISSVQKHNKPLPAIAAKA